MPKKPKSPCSYPGCPNLCYGQYCDDHKTSENRKYDRYERNQTAAAVYRSKCWQAVRKKYYEAHPLCEECLTEERLTPAEEVHHIVPLSAGGEPFAFSNLRSLCRSCHQKEHHRLGKM